VGALLAVLAAPVALRGGTVTVGGGEDVDRYARASSMNTAGDTWK